MKHTTDKNREKALDFSFLVIGLCAWMMSYIVVKGNIWQKRILILLLGIAYTASGVWHHRSQKFGKKEIIGEYAAMGILIMALFAGSTFIFRF